MNILLGTRKGALLIERRSNGWEITEHDLPGAAVSYALYDPRHKTTWLGTSHGHWGSKLYRKSSEVTEVACPAYEEGMMVREGKPATLEYIWNMVTGGDDHPDRLWIGSVPGGLFKSDDYGESWELNDALWNDPSRETYWFGGGFGESGIHSVLVDPTDSSHITVAVSCAGCYESFDGGESWSIKNDGMEMNFAPENEYNVGYDPHLISLSPDNPKQLWQQNHDGIYRWSEQDNKWKRVDVGRGNGLPWFGFPVAVDQNDADRAWVVPATSDEYRVAPDGAVKVCRTDDAGESWKTFDKGLPQKDSFDITYRHGLDHLDGTVAFGTTTGSLFISEDGGETWDHVFGHLPQIYSLQLY